jgi:hypothetical protein
VTAALHIALEFARAEGAGQPHGFRFAPQTYLLRNPGGDFAAAELPWTRELLADLRALRGAAPDPDVAHRIGAVLQQFLAPSAWPAHEPAIVRATRSGTPVVITVRSAAAELYALPWELLTLRETGQQLGGLPGLLVRHEWPATTTAPDAVDPAARAGRALFAWSAAGGAVPAADHLAALKAHVPGFDPERDVLAHAGFAALAAALERAAKIGPPIDVLHLLGHGAAIGTTYGLALDDPAGGPALVDAGRLQQLLAPHAGMLRAVVVAACDSGNVGEPGNHLGSVAQMIHRAGLRSVVASRYPLSAAGSSRFASELFAALGERHAALEHAFVAARDVLVRDPQQLDWASVQLYAREADGLATHPFVRGPAARRRFATISAGLAAAGALALAAALWSGDPHAVPEAPAEPAIVAPDPPPAAPPVTPPITPPPDVTAPQPTPTIVDPSEPVTKQPPRPPQPRPPACRATAGACPAAIVAHLKGQLNRQPPLKITVRCDGGLDYVVLDASRDSAAALDERRGFPDLGNTTLPTRHLADLPCKYTLK